MKIFLIKEEITLAFLPLLLLIATELDPESSKYLLNFW